ncbi:hypothetical protein N2152v2_001958 [Parachlorella kessleri]
MSYSLKASLSRLVPLRLGTCYNGLRRAQQARTYPRLPAAPQPWYNKTGLLARRSSLRDYADPDDYELEEELEYDSDDYGYYLEEDRGSLPPLSSRAALAGPASGLANPSRATQAATPVVEGIQPIAAAAELAEAPSAQADGEPSGPLGTAFAPFSLLIRSVGAFVRHVHLAASATGAAIQLLLQQVVYSTRVGARAFSLRARRSLRRGLGREKVGQLRESVRTTMAQLPEPGFLGVAKLGEATCTGNPQQPASSAGLQGFWGKLLWLWDRPPVQKLRLTWSLANIGIKLPAVLALVATQVGLLASQVSLPMLAPLLLGTGMLLRSIRSNASFLFPRIGLFVVLAWLLWFANSVMQNTVAYLRRQGAVDNRLASFVITASECLSLLSMLLVLLSMLGVNIGSALLLPAGLAVAVAGQQLAGNWLAGFFLFMAQPFKLGDRVAVSFSSPGAPGAFTSNWFEGVCEKIDLRYTMIRQGSRRLMVPNQHFLTREFMIVDDIPTAATAAVGSSRSGSSAASGSGGSSTPGLNGSSHYPRQPVPAAGGYSADGGAGVVDPQRAAWLQMQIMQHPPYHQELLQQQEDAADAGPPAGHGQHPQEGSPGGLRDSQQHQQHGHQQHPQQGRGPNGHLVPQRGGLYMPPPPQTNGYLYQALPPPPHFDSRLPSHSSYGAGGVSVPGWGQGGFEGHYDPYPLGPHGQYHHRPM